LFSKLSLQFQKIISNSFRMYNLTVNVFKIIRWGYMYAKYTAAYTLSKKVTF